MKETLITNLEVGDKFFMDYTLEEKENLKCKEKITGEDDFYFDPETKVLIEGKAELSADGSDSIESSDDGSYNRESISTQFKVNTLLGMYHTLVSNDRMKRANMVYNKICRLIGV